MAVSECHQLETQKGTISAFPHKAETVSYALWYQATTIVVGSKCRFKNEFRIHYLIPAPEQPYAKGTTDYCAI